MLQVAFTPDGLKKLWNELVKDGEIPANPTDVKVNTSGVPAHKGESGHYYCGSNILSCSCCDGQCGPDVGCNCLSCQKLDQEEREQKEEEEQQLPAAGTMMDSWIWGDQPSETQLQEALQALILEQHKLASQAAGTTLSAIRLQQRLAVLGRYFISLSRHKQTVDDGNKDKGAPKVKTKTSLKMKTRYYTTTPFIIF